MTIWPSCNWPMHWQMCNKSMKLDLGPEAIQQSLKKLAQITKKTYKELKKIYFENCFFGVSFKFWIQLFLRGTVMYCSFYAKWNNKPLNLLYISSFFIRTTHLPQLQVQLEVQVELEKKKTPKEKYFKRELTYTRYVLIQQVK